MQEYILEHNSHDLFFRNPFGAVPCESKIMLSFKVVCRTDAHSPKFDKVIYLYLKEELSGANHEYELPMKQEEEQDGTIIYKTEITAPAEPGLLWYYFIVRGKGTTSYYGNSLQNKGGRGTLYDYPPPAYQVTVYSKDLAIPRWFKESVMYQIFPDRFFNGSEDGKVLNPKKNSLLHSHWENTPVYIRDLPSGKVIRWDFFGGNLEGIKKKLAYLKNLGVSLLYLNPVFEAPSNHRYDTADYHKIDPMLGDNELFHKLCAEARQMGINIILDGVFSHTGSDSIYFNKEGNYPGPGAYQSPDSPYFSWYRFSEYPHSYECWWGIETLPNVNELDPSYLDFIIFGENSVLKHWMSKGIKGWRLDVVDELPGEFLKKFRQNMKKIDKEAILIGEVWEDASNKISYGERRRYLQGKELDGVTNYPLRQIMLDFVLQRQDAADVRQALLSLFENYPLDYFYSTMNLVGSHDVPRILTVLEDGLPAEASVREKKALRLKRLKMVSLWQMTFPGVPCIYYGDEAGLEGGTDPLNRGTYPWGREDEDILEWYRKLVALRNHYDVLRGGWWKPLFASGSVFVFGRKVEEGRGATGSGMQDNTAIVLLNRDSRREESLSLDLKDWCGKELVDPLHNYERVSLESGFLQLTLKPLESRILLEDRWSANRSCIRESGILLHPTSLPSPFGIGDLGKGARLFLDFLVQSGQTYWQVLPLNPPGSGQSPYQCFSAFAGNPLLIDLEQLADEGLINRPDEKNLPGFLEDRVNYEEAKKIKEYWLGAAFRKFTTLPRSAAYVDFCERNAGWLDDYALFMALKESFGGKPWNRWDPAIASRQPAVLENSRKALADRIEYQKFLQYIFFTQWKELKKNAREKGIKIIGDMPIFVSHDSSDVWCSPAFFELDSRGEPLKVAGVPPDYFSETGQLWGNPHYRWSEMEKDGYRWWQERFRVLFELVDMVRIDHFRGFEAYWEIPAGEKTAVNGRWVKGPGEEFFLSLQEVLGDFPVIAEDLGVITAEVEEMKLKLGFPGMKVLQFMMEPRLDQDFNLPLYDKDNILYTGTHDNDTILGWYEKGKKGRQVKTPGERREISWHFVEMAMESDARTVIIPLQDILSLGTEARMNTPGTVENNWLWRFPERLLTGELAQCLQALTEKSHRKNPGIQ